MLGWRARRDLSAMCTDSWRWQQQNPNGFQATGVAAKLLEDFKALEETAYLLRNPTNAKRLLAAASQLNAGKGVERKLAR